MSSSSTVEKKLELKDYLHLYLGCEVISESYKITEDKPERLICIHWYFNSKYDRSTVSITHRGSQIVIETEFIKPILRPLSDMQQDEKHELNKILNKYKDAAPATIEAFRVHYMLSKHFDLFQLIENNLAIDKNN